jgi:DNA-directed RNA polymerase subunit RPC12/RpoP
VVLAPSERSIVDVLVERPGELHLEHHTPDRVYRLAAVAVAGGPVASTAAEFPELRRAPELEAERQQLDRWLAAPPDKVLALVAQMDDPAAMPAGAGPITYACPMHPEVTSDEPGRCPKCGMKLLATQAPAATAYACPMHPEVTSEEPGRCPKCGMKLLATQAPAASPTSYVCPMHPEVTSQEPGRCPRCGMKLLAASSVPKPAAADASAMDEHGGHAGHDHGGHHGEGHGRAEGIEWEDDMVQVNRLTTTATMHWRFLDRTSGADSPAIDWQFTVGERVKLRLVNELDSDHPMHHPFHLHGAGRFLVLSRNGVPEANLVWKDTVLVRTGQTVDILFDVTNPGVVDGPLPHRRAPAERHDVQLHRRPRPGGGHMTAPTARRTRTRRATGWWMLWWSGVARLGWPWPGTWPSRACGSWCWRPLLSSGTPGGPGGIR